LGVIVGKKMIKTDIEINKPDFPIIACAIHNGHHLRDELVQLSALDNDARLREEDPFTGEWTNISDNRIIVQTSRFEVDLNRVKHEAIYINPEDAWGLDIWKEKPDVATINRSLTAYDEFYAQVHKTFTDFQNRFKKFFVFDLHVYNHLRDGPDGKPADPKQNPEVNIGTGTMDRTKWANIIERFIEDLRGFDYLDRHLDVRENVKFYGRQFAQWSHDHFPESACVLSVEFKKFFMDEWTGKADQRQMGAIVKALKSTIPGILNELKH